MAYRVQELVEVCSCGQVADCRCPRCGLPLCGTHNPGTARRCDPCESQYLSKETRQVRQVAIPLVVVAGVTGLIGSLATHFAHGGILRGPHAHFAPALIFASMLMFAACFMSPWLVRWRSRRTFLAECRGGASQ